MTYEHRAYGVSLVINDRLAGAWLDFWEAKVYEPEMRNKDGLRWIRHRFQIKGGISQAEVMRRNMMRPNPLLELLRSKGIKGV